MDRQGLLHQLRSYQTSFTEEEKFIQHFLELLKNENAFQRTHLPGHVTGSAWIINKDGDQTLMVNHVKLNKWLQPGGHADGDENVLRVALREAEEETGLKNFKVRETLFDIDIHTIPARKNFPAHLHYDIRYLLEADINESILVSEESHDVKWIPLVKLEKFTTEESVFRMRKKVST
jgi:8-oxo-dGTP pyrophosphatase MutT (NUDIX family)